MAKLPDVTAFGARPIPRVSRPIVDTGRISGGYAAAADIAARDSSQSGLSLLSKSLSRSAEIVNLADERQREKDERLALGKAVSDFNVFGIKVSSDLLQDQDWRTYGERYRKTISESRNRIAASLPANVKDEFFIRTDEDATRIMAGVFKTGIERRGKETITTLTQTRDDTLAAVSTMDSGSRARAFENYNSMIDAAQGAGDIDPLEAAKAKREFASNYVESATLSWVKTQADPWAALKEIQDGKLPDPVLQKMYDLMPPDQREKSLTLVETKLRENVTQVRADAAFQRQQHEAEQQKIGNELFQKFLAAQQGLGPPPTLAEISSSGLDYEGQARFVTWIKAIGDEEKIKTDPGLFISLWDRVHLPDGDSKKIVKDTELDSYVGHGLTVSDVSTLRNELQGENTQAGKLESDLKNGLITAAKSALTGTDPLMRLRDPNGDIQLQKFMSWFLPEYQKQRQGGKSAIQLLDPDSSEYLGKAIDRFKRSPQQMFQDMIRDNPGMVAAPDTGQSTPQAAPKTYSSPEEVKDDYNAGNLTRDQAAKILRDKGWAQ